MDIKKGELVSFNPLLEEIKVNLIDDELEREKAETTGYYAMFEYMNGFRKEMYWSKEKMLSHADKYSSAFDKLIYQKLQSGERVQDAWKYSSFWYKDFDAMAFKTMLRQLISKWGIMSTEMTEAFTKDNAVINVNGDYDYIDVKTDEDNETLSSVKSNKQNLSDEEFNKIIYDVLNDEGEIQKMGWKSAVQSGKRTTDQAIKTLQSKHGLTDSQINQIKSWGDQQ